MVRRASAHRVVGADQGTSFEQLVIDNEWASAFNHIFNLGVEVSEETLGVDLIKKVGVGGSYIAEEHTVSHARETYWKSDLFNQASWDSWMENGGKSVYQMAHEKVERILAKHYPPEILISPAAAEKIGAIIEIHSIIVGHHIAPLAEKCQSKLIAKSHLLLAFFYPQTPIQYGRRF